MSRSAQSASWRRRNAWDTPEEVAEPWTMKVEIRSDMAGRIVGRKGDNKKRIEQETGAQVRVEHPQIVGDWVRVIASGAAEQVMNAFKEVKAEVAKFSVQISNELKPKFTTPEIRGRNLDLIRMREGQKNSAEWSHKDMEVKITLSAAIPTIKRVAGTNLENLNRIQQETGAEIVIEARNKVKEFQKVWISGSVDNSLKAAHKVTEAIESYQPCLDGSYQQSLVNEKDLKVIKAEGEVKIVKHAAPFFIGKGGKNIKSIRTETNVESLDIDGMHQDLFNRAVNRACTEDDDDAFETVTVSGYVSPVLEAIQRIKALMVKYPGKEFKKSSSSEVTRDEPRVSFPLQDQSVRAKMVQTAAVTIQCRAAQMSPDHLSSLSSERRKQLWLPEEVVIFSRDGQSPQITLRLEADGTYHPTVDDRHPYIASSSNQETPPGF